MTNNRSRGNYWEARAAERIGGHKVSMSRRTSTDVVKRDRPLYQRMRTFEIKRLASGLKMLTDFVDQAKKDGSDAVMIRIGRRREWLFVTVLPDDEPIFEPEWEAK